LHSSAVAVAANNDIFDRQLAYSELDAGPFRAKNMVGGDNISGVAKNEQVPRVR